MKAKSAENANKSERVERLKQRKGQVSRQIGEAKRIGEPIEHLLNEMKDISAELKSIRPSLPKQKTREGQAFTTENRPGIPGLFSPPVEKDVSIEEIELQVLHHTNVQYAEKWQAYVEANPRCSAYHRLEFRNIIESVLKQNTLYLIAIDKNGEPVGVLPSIQLNSRLFGNYVVSMPYFNYGGAVGDSEAIENLMMQNLWQQYNGASIEHIEYRDTHQRLDYQRKTSKVAMIRELPDSIESLWQQLGTKVRAQVKKADRWQPTGRIGGEELLDDFYRVFSRNMRDLGTPVYSKAFFGELLKLEKTPVALVVCYFEGEPASCALLLGHKDSLEIPWASTLKKFNARNMNMYLYWQVLSYAVQEKYQFFDFGRSSKDAGTYRFKKQWGATAMPLYWHYQLPGNEDLPEINPDNPKYRLLITLWKKLPVWLTRVIGPLIVRNLP